MIKGFRRTALVAVAAITLIGCGGAHKSARSTTTTQSPTTSASTSTHAAPVSVSSAPLTIEVKAGTPEAPLGTTLRGAAGQSIQFRIQAARTKPGHTTRLSIEFPGGRARRLRVVARGAGHTAGVSIVGAKGAKVSLESIRFTCSLPPAPTVCPPLSERGGSRGSHLELAVGPAPIMIAATIGPVATKPVRRPPDGAVVPPYTATEQVRAVQAGAPPSPKTKAVYAQTAAVHPTDTVVLLTRLSGKLVGAPQNTTVTIDQGPGKSLAVTAQVHGAPESTALIKSATGSPITMVLPRYTCFVPPSPTFCPLKGVQVGHHSYELSFSLTPFNPAVIVLATVEAG